MSAARCIGAVFRLTTLQAERVNVRPTLCSDCSCKTASELDRGDFAPPAEMASDGTVSCVRYIPLTHVIPPLSQG